MRRERECKEGERDERWRARGGYVRVSVCGVCRREMAEGEGRLQVVWVLRMTGRVREGGRGCSRERRERLPTSMCERDDRVCE